MCILLAFRPLWFNIAAPDMTPHHRQKAGDISLDPCDVKRRWSFLQSPSIMHEQLGRGEETGQNLETIRSRGFSLMAVSSCGRFDEVQLSH